MTHQITFAIKTLGCKVNQYESNSIYQKLRQLHFKETIAKEADVWIINTCTVTAISDKKCKQMIKRAIKENPSRLIVVTGCLAVSNADTIRNITGVDLVLTNAQKETIAQEIFKALNKKIEVNPFSKKYLYKRGKTRSFIKIQDGCQAFCAYCKIPYVRGEESSRDFNDIINEATLLSSQGCKEIVLTGIHLGRYNYQSPKKSLAPLIKELNTITSLSRIRLSSIAVLEFDDRLLEVVSNSAKVCPNFHISLQSGSDTILKRMNRNYTANTFKQIIDKIKKRIPDATFTTDVIVGFPGETDNYFKETLDMLTYVKFHRVHLFPFSRREGTKAYDFQDTIEQHIIKKRMHIISELANQIAKAHYKNLEGTQKEILLENKNKDGFWQGYTRHYEKIRLKAPNLKSNQEVTVIIKTGKQDEAIASLP